MNHGKIAVDTCSEEGKSVCRQTVCQLNGTDPIIVKNIQQSFEDLFALFRVNVLHHNERVHKIEFSDIRLEKFGGLQEYRIRSVLFFELRTASASISVEMSIPTTSILRTASGSTSRPTPHPKSSEHLGEKPEIKLSSISFWTRSMCSSPLRKNSISAAGSMFSVLNLSKTENREVWIVLSKIFPRVFKFTHGLEASSRRAKKLTNTMPTTVVTPTLNK